MTRRTKVLALAAILVVSGFAGCAVNDWSDKQPVEGAPKHHVAGGFRNLPGSAPRSAKFSDWAGFFFRRVSSAFADPPTVPDGHVLDPVAARAGFQSLNGADGITWLGHAGFLVRLDGMTILTDPFLSERASPFSFMGPKRFAGPALKVDDLPQVDILVVSHNHYDHLDAPTVEAMAGKDNIQVVVPLGLGAFFRKRGFKRIHELDWFGAVEIGGLTITALPSVHFSRRTPFNENKVLWSAFAFKSSKHKIFFAGDTGYGTVFKDLGARFGPFDVGLLPIGAYEPQIIMRAVHTTPEEAVRMGRDLNIETLVAMHWGTITLTEELPLEPPGRFLKAGRLSGYDDKRLWLLKIGETRVLD
jgi:N-acyl-phosphatidylethanolamine-hydrolysing phospholipase D